MFDDYDDYNKDVNQAIDIAKQIAIEAYNEHSSKIDVISYVVGSFVLANLKQISPRPKLLKRYFRGEPVSFNMILDSIDEKGILIGATAYRLAEQLETELVDNGIKPKSQPPTVYVNGQLIPEMSSCDIPISVTYFKYFEQEPFSIFQHNQYWFQHIGDTTPKDDYTKRQILIGYISLQKLCFAPAYSLFIYDALKRLNAEPDIKTDIENLDILKEDVATQLDNHEFDSDDKDRQTALSVLDGITKVMNHFIYLAKMQE